jgi:hypothetical protein
MGTDRCLGLAQGWQYCYRVLSSRYHSSKKDLIELGFKRKDNAPDNWHYYTLDIGDLCLISDDSDVVEDNNWKVYIFDCDGFQITELEKLKLFIDVLNEIKI